MYARKLLEKAGFYARHHIRSPKKQNKEKQLPSFCYFLRKKFNICTEIEQWWKEVVRSPENVITSDSTHNLDAPLLLCLSSWGGEEGDATRVSESTTIQTKSYKRKKLISFADS
eukprot:GEMP01066664.1.p1 GENE.GEMP01066664.1~~GEMP01066664.1.p1  ORF type:complete len:114 (-),score=7.02 GEMP01066664.1:383-724(-)